MFFRGRHLAGICIIILGFMFFLMNVILLHQMQEKHQSISIRFEEATISEDTLENILADQDTDSSTTFFERKEKEKIHNPAILTEAKINVILFDGWMEQIIPMDFIKGNPPISDDLEGCVLDSITAYQLFGSINVLGEGAWWGDKEYYIRGVVKAEDQVLLIRQKKGQNQYNRIYSNMELVQKKNSSTSQVKSFLSMHSIEQSYVVINAFEMMKFLSCIIFLPYWIFTIWLGIYLLKLLYRNRKEKWRGKGKNIICSGFTLICLLFSGAPIPLYLPLDFIPNRWSDFSFYSDKWRETEKWIADLSNIQLLPKDYILFGNIAVVFILLLLSCTCIIVGSLVAERKNMGKFYF